jgi:DNA helicase HerA-like ATPase
LINAAGGVLVILATHPQNLRIVWIPLLVLYASVLFASAYVAVAGETHMAVKVVAPGVAEYNAGITKHRVLLLEEAHTFIPEFGFRDRNDETWVSTSGRCIMQSRKFGLRFVIISQRSAVVTKSALSQCENYIAFKTIDDTSLNYLESVVGSEVRRIITGLARYEAVYVGPAFNSEAPVIINADPPPPVPSPPDDVDTIFGKAP